MFYDFCLCELTITITFSFIFELKKKTFFNIIERIYKYIHLKKMYLFNYSFDKVSSSIVIESLRSIKTNTLIKRIMDDNKTNLYCDKKI